MNNLEYKIITTKHGQTGYVQLGSGEPLIMIVGYSGNLLHWNSELIYSLARKYTVYLPDNRLIGLSYSSNNESMNGMADDIADFIEAIGFTSAHICGWSMGGIMGVD